MIDPSNFVRWDKNHERLFQGNINKKKFRVTRILPQKTLLSRIFCFSILTSNFTSPLPVLYGKFIPTDNGTRVVVRITFAPIFMVWLSVLTVFVIIIGLVFIWPIFFVLLTIFFACKLFWDELPLAERELKQLIDKTNMTYSEPVAGEGRSWPRAPQLFVVEDAAHPRQSPRIPIRGLLGALRLTTSECSRQRSSASKLASVLAADPRRLTTWLNIRGISIRPKFCNLHAIRCDSRLLLFAYFLLSNIKNFSRWDRTVL